VRSPWLFALTNQTALVEQFGDHFTYSNYSRALIFAARQGAVGSAADFRALLRYNEFGSDATGGQGCVAPARSASNSLSERGDLNPGEAACPTPGLSLLDEGSIDGKMTNLAMMSAGGAGVSMVQNGPTWDSQPPFVWSASPFAAIAHAGQPDGPWRFDWLPVAPGAAELLESLDPSAL
jgi:hypothetical protein